MTDAWIIRWFKRQSLPFHSRRYLRRAPDPGFEPPGAVLSPHDGCQTEPQKVLLAKVADKNFLRYVCGQTVITGAGSELWRVTLVKDSLFLRVGPIFDKPNFHE